MAIALFLPCCSKDFRGDANFVEFSTCETARGARYLHDKFSADSLLASTRIRPCAPENLVDDCKTETCSAGKAGLKWLENAAWPGRVDADIPVSRMEIRVQVGIGIRLTERSHRSGIARSALLHRFQKTCFRASRSARARDFANSKIAAQSDTFPRLPASRSMSSKVSSMRADQVHFDEANSSSRASNPENR